MKEFLLTKCAELRVNQKGCLPYSFSALLYFSPFKKKKNHIQSSLFDKLKGLFREFGFLKVLSRRDTM